MYLLDWSNLQPSSADWQQAIHQNSGVFHVRVLLLKFVESLLSAPTWDNRSDTVPLFDPINKYKQDESIALLRRDPHSVHPDSWRIGKVKKVEDTSNPLQGSFQVVSVSVDGKEEAYASGITGAQPLSFQLPTGTEEREMLAAEFVDAFFEALKKNLQDAVEEGLISAEINGDKVLIGDSAFIGEIEREFIDLFFSELPQEQPYLTTENIYRRLRELDALSDIPKDGALFSLRLCLEEMGYKSLGNNQWISHNAFEKLNREVKRYLPVPRIRTRVEDEENIELPRDFENFVKDLGEEEPPQPEEPTAHWQPPAQPLAIGYLSFLNLREGYFPLADIDKAFPPELDHMLVNVQIVEGSNLFAFLVDRQNGVLKSVNPTAFRDKLTGLGIWAGVRLWLAYQSEGMYRIYPKPITQPRQITCKQIWLDEGGNLQAEVIPIELQYEADEHIFKADLRLMDPEALEAQAQQSNRSIFDCMRKAFPVLAALDSQGRVHYKDLFQMVFFQDRMCSPRTVISNLYSYECFSPVGQGLFTFDPSRGPHRRHALRRTVRVVQPRVSMARPGVTAEYEPWITISQLVGQQLQTLKQREPFTVLDLNDTAVLIRTSTGKTRSIDRYRIDRAWNHLLANGDLSRAEIQKNFSNFNPAYVAAILSQVPSVSVSSTSPITLAIVQRTPSQMTPEVALPLPEKSAAEPVSAEVKSEESPLSILERMRSGQLIAPDLLPKPPLLETYVLETETPETIETAAQEAQPAAHAVDIVQHPPAVEPVVTIPSSLDQESIPPTPPAAEPLQELATWVAPIQAARRPNQNQKLPDQTREDMQNKTLFSRHYLDQRLPNLDEWKEDPLPVIEQIRLLWKKATQYGTTWNEAQTENELIQPILNLLGWKYTVQVKSVKKGQVKRPDYALFGDDNAKNAAYPHQGNDDTFYSYVLAIAEAKHWDRSLSEKDSSGRATWKSDSNPSHQMVSYLVGTRSPWGILTNGRTWRLYSREVSSTASEYYEIDLGLLFDFLPEGVNPSEVQVEQFKRWWLFFRKQSFIPTLSGKSFVQRVHEGSTTYAREISDKLKNLVFDKIMPEIAGGFVAYRFNEMGLQEETEESLVEIYRASLSLLYKILFLLYAEARGLLPMENAGYRQESLTELARWAAEQIDRQLPLSHVTYATPRYSSLLALFRRIDKGDVSLGIPQYNGGLFSQKNPENQFLMQHRLSDWAVAHMIDYLAREGGQPVDYAYISVRNLGAIYEGLLENKLNILDAAAGKVELINDKGERKASGSYYTPDYIVDYIVQNTLDPILNERQVVFEKAMEKVAILRRKLKKATDSALNKHLQMELADAEREAREAFLGIKVLDPAMGSGHFLVNAVDHLTDGIIQRIEEYHGTNITVPREWNPIQQLIEEVRKSILQEMERQGLVVDIHRLDDTALFTRLVMKRCIYGVDLNPMAVELAKVSLWLHSFTIGAPLSFLDHHLRWGDSLLGTEVREVEKAVQQGPSGQLGLFSGPFAGLLDLTSIMVQVAERADATLSDVRQSAEAYEQFQKELIPYKQALDIWVSYYFGNSNAFQFLSLFGNDVLPTLKGEREVEEKYKQAIESARELWKKNRFFHWDLEFPEVFVDLYERNWAKNPGFDAVIGNPPYVRQEELGAIKVFLNSRYSHVYNGIADLSLYFLNQGTKLLRNSGLLSFITSKTFVKLAFGENMRKFLSSKVDVQKIVDFGETQVFSDAITYPFIILICNREADRLPTTIINAENGVIDEAKKSEYLVPKEGKAWTFTFGSLSRVIEGWDSSVSLGSIVKNIYRGITTGLNNAFVVNNETYQNFVSNNPKAKDVLKPFLKGENVERWYPDLANEWIIVFPSGWTRENFGKGINEQDAWKEVQKNYPSIAQYLSQFEIAARKRSDRGEFWWELRPCNYYWTFEKPRIYSTKISYRPTYCLYESIGYAGNTAYVIPITNNVDGYFLLAILNSTVSGYYSRKVFSPKANNYYEIQPGDLSLMPIPKVQKSLSEGQLSSFLSGLKDLYGHYVVNKSYMTRSSSEIVAAIKHHSSLKNFDLLHDFLVYLSKEMTQSSGVIQTEVKGFLSWLEKEVKTDLSSWTGKSDLMFFVGDYNKNDDHLSFEELYDTVKRNQKRIQVKTDKRSFQENLEREYLLSLEKLLPVKDKLRATDWLINQIVYCFYDLSDSEVMEIEKVTK